MAGHIFSDEAEFIYSLFLEHYENGKINNHSLMIGCEEYENTIDYVAFEQGLNELLENNLISDYKSCMGGAFYIPLRLK